MALWTPAHLATPPAQWLDMGDPTTYTLDVGVAERRDKSGNSRHATQPTAAKQPTLSAASFNGLDVDSYDGSDDNMAISVPQAVPCHIFAVLRAGSLQTATRAIMERTTSTAPYPPTVYAGCDTVNYGPAIFWGTSFTKKYSVGVRTDYVAEFRLSSTQVGIRVNGGTEQTASHSNTVLSTWSHIGTTYTPQAALLGMAETLIINYALTTDERQQIEGYLAWKWGLQAGLDTSHPYKSAAPVLPTLFRSVLEQPYDLLPYLVRAILDQPYGLMIRLAQLFDQVYGLRMMVAFHQYYGDAAQLRRGFDQRYGDAAKLRRKFEQLYGDNPRYRAALEQLYNLHAGLRAGFEQNYSIAEGQVKAALEQIYNIQDKDLLRATLDMLYVLAAGEALVQRFDIEVTCDGVAHNSMSNINVEQDDSSFHMSGDLQLYDEAEALQYRPFASAVSITVDSWTCQLICGFMREARTPGQTIYVVPLFSRTILLDAPHSRLAAGELSGMASALVAALAAPVTVSWQLVDWFIPPGRLAVNEGDAAINVIRRITEAVGGIIQTDPDGVLICRPEYPVSVDKWDAATPDYYLTDQDDFFQVDHAPEMRDGYNLVQVSDQQLTTGGLTLEVTTIDPYISEVRVYQVPWDDDSIIRLRHSGDPGRVSIVAHGIQTEQIAAEQIEIVAGSGRTSKPFYRLVSTDYREAELGTITIAEDGSVTTETAENSLVAIDYETRCWLFTVTDYTAEDVQFFPEESAA